MVQRPRYAASCRSRLSWGLRAWLIAQPRSTCAVGLGLRARGGVRGGEPVVVVLVDDKRPLAAVPPGARVPPSLLGWPTDVRDSGPFFGCSSRQRPALGGASIGHYRGESGTLGCLARSHPRVPGERPLLLSNNHVLTRYNQASAGDPIIQPAKAALGYAPADTVALLSRWVPLALEPPVPQAEHRNRVDAAVAEVTDSALLGAALQGLGAISAWRATADLPIGLAVAKSGAISGVTLGEITVIEASARLNFHGVGVALMEDQILTSHLTESGDSGALVVAAEPVGWSAVGLACGASRRFTMVNPIEVVQALLSIRVAELRWREK